MSYRFPLAFIGVMIAGVSIATPASAANVTDPKLVAASPVPGTPLGKSGDHEVILLELAPGESSTQTIRLTNTYDTANQVVVRGIDVNTNSLTGFGFTGVTDPVVADGNWITVATPKLTMGPRESRDVGFTITVPDDARPGQHLAAVAVYTPTVPPADGATNGNQMRAQIITQPQRAIIVQVQTPGAAVAQLATSGARPMATADGVALGITLANEGTAIASGTGVVTVPSTGLRTEFPIVAFVPATSVELIVPWTASVVAGRHDVQVQLFFNGDRTANWTGTVDISGELMSQLQKSLDDRAIAEASAPSGSSNLWWFVAAGVVLFVGLAVALARPRSRKSPVVAGNGDVDDLLRMHRAAAAASDVALQLSTSPEPSSEPDASRSTEPARPTVTKVRKGQ